jgi:hypothetical protein
MKFWIKGLVGLLMVPVLGAAWFLTTNSRAGVANAPYTVLETAGDKELRDYPELKLVQTPMEAKGKDGSFMRLFRYISGTNAAEQKIAMTSPVMMERGEQKTMSFVLPEDVAKAGGPKPGDTSVVLKTLPPGRVATLRFPGTDTPETEAKAREQLMAWVKKKGWVAEGEVWFAYYDPPWTPTALRRNEAMVRVR